MLNRIAGTICLGLRIPLVHQGDDLAALVVEAVLGAAQQEGFLLHNKDILGIAEAVLARAPRGARFPWYRGIPCGAAPAHSNA